MPIADIIRRLESRIRDGRNALLRRAFLEGLLRLGVCAAAVVWAILVTVALRTSAPQLLLPLGLLGLAALVGLVAYFGITTARRMPRTLAYAAWLEERAPELRSRLVNALEMAPTVRGQSATRGATSTDLMAEVVRDAETKVSQLDLPALVPSTLTRTWRQAAVAVAAVWALSLVFARGPLSDAGWALLHPVAAAERAVTLHVWPGDVTLEPGADLLVEARVTGAPKAPQLRVQLGGSEERIEMKSGRAPGSGLREDLGEAYWARVPAVAASGTYEVRAEAVTSPLYRVGLAGQAAPVAFEIHYQYPAYTGRAPEVQSAPRADLVALTGTRVGVTVLLDRDVESVRWSLDGEVQRESPRRWVGETILRVDGEYEIVVQDGENSARETYRMEAIPDRPPVLTVLEPQRSLDLPAGQKLPLSIAATDDYGLLDWHLIVRLGADAPEMREKMPGWSGEPNETQAAAIWDLSPLGLLPGQEVTFFLEVRDNDRVSGPKATRSPPLVVRFPLLSEIYEEIEAEHATAADQLERARRDAEELARQVEDANRELDRQRPGRQSGSSWEKQQAARDVAERQQEIADRLSEMQESFERAAESAAEHDVFRQEILAKMQEIARLMRELESPELRDAMQKLQEAIENSDRRAMEEAMRQLELNQKELLENLERTKELLERIRQEERLDSAARRAEELAERQEELNRQMEGAQDEAKREQLAAEQERAQRDAESLRRDLEELSKELAESRRQEAAQESQEAAEELEQTAEPKMQEAGESLQQGQRQQAQQSGQQAQQSLSETAQRLSDASQQMGQQIDQEQVAAVRRAAQDLVNLSQRQEDALQDGEGGRPQAQRQKDLQEGAERVADDLRDVSKDTPFLDGKAGQKLEEAMRRLERASEAFERGDQSEGEQQGEGAASALNEAVIALRETEQSMCQGQNPGQNPSGRQQLQQMIGQQTQLNRDTQSLADQLAQQQRLLASDQASVQEMAARQEAIRRGIEESMAESGDGDVLGNLDEAKREMEEVARRLAREDLDRETLERQNRILSRLLDANRSVNRREFREERESESGRQVAREAPRALTREQMGSPERARHDLLRSQAERYAPEYRNLVEAYLRRLQEGR